jgi:hypothetical protein
LLDEILSQISNPSGNNSGNPIANTVLKAMALAKALIGHQKEQRAEPFVQELQKFGQMYATDPMANENANKTRAAYLASGGSPIDIPQALWGADPSQGFQTGKGAFTPGYAGDNMSLGQKEKLAGITGRYEGKLTWPAFMQQEGVRLQGTQMANQMQNAQMDYNAAMANLGETVRYRNIENDRYIATNTYVMQVLGAATPQDAFDYLNKYGSQIAADGADMSVILKAMTAKWPEYFARYSGTVGGMDMANPYAALQPGAQGTNP